MANPASLFDSDPGVVSAVADALKVAGDIEKARLKQHQQEIDEHWRTIRFMVGGGVLVFAMTQEPLLHALTRASADRGLGTRVAALLRTTDAQQLQQRSTQLHRCIDALRATLPAGDAPASRPLGNDARRELDAACALLTVE